jgi:hypothetical protein
LTADAALLGLALDVAQMVLKIHSQVACCAPEFCHHSSQCPRQFREFFGAENDESHDEDYD